MTKPQNPITTTVKGPSSDSHRRFDATYKHPWPNSDRRLAPVRLIAQCYKEVVHTVEGVVEQNEGACGVSWQDESPGLDTHAESKRDDKPTKREQKPPSQTLGLYFFRETM